MLGELCVILPVAAPDPLTLPCTLPSCFTASSQLLICEALFWSIKNSATDCAVLSVIAPKIVSSTLYWPASVFCLNLTPTLCNLLTICCLLPTLNSSTPSFSRLPVFSLHRSVMIGGNNCCNSASSSRIRVLTLE